MQAYIPLMLKLVKLTLLCLVLTSAPAAALQRVAVFGFELLDTSLDGSIYGTTQQEKERLEKLGEQLRKALADTGRFEIADIGPVEEAARSSNLQACGGCDIDFAKKVGADFSITGVVQKVSNLILNINIYVRDTADGKLIKSMSADMRGNTDESWSRTMSWLIRNRLLTGDWSASAKATQ
jgi:Protein of unknown function (DUF2380)